MRALRSSYLGRRRFPQKVSAFEVRRFFTLTPEDHLALRRRFRSRASLGAALQLGFLRMTGTTLDLLNCERRAVLDRASRRLGVNAPELPTLPALYRRQMMLCSHRRWGMLEIVRGQRPRVIA